MAKKNPFKHIEPSVQPPEDLKEEIIQEVEEIIQEQEDEETSSNSDELDENPIQDNDQ